MCLVPCVAPAGWAGRVSRGTVTLHVVLSPGLLPVPNHIYDLVQLRIFDKGGHRVGGLCSDREMTL